METYKPKNDYQVGGKIQSGTEDYTILKVYPPRDGNAGALLLALSVLVRAFGAENLLETQDGIVTVHFEEMDRDIAQNYAKYIPPLC